MIRRSLREWDYLPVKEEGADHSVSRTLANSLIATIQNVGIRGADRQAVLVDRHTHLQAQQIVGVIAAPGVTLEILPKIDSLDTGGARRNLVHMLAVVFDMKLASGGIASLGWQQDDFLEILIKHFCDQLFEAVRRGLPRRYVDEATDLTALRGRLDIQRQFTVLAVSPQKLACRYQELSPDIALNQIMKAAVSRLSGIARTSENQRRLAELAFAFADVATVSANQLPWGSVVLDRTNLAWETLFNSARLILGRHFQTTSTGTQRGVALVFEMNTLFEEYIGRTIRHALMGTDLEVRLQGPRNHVLLEEDGTLRFATKPDIVVSRGGLPVLIIDTKWKSLTGAIDDPKRGVSQADVYQMMAYSHVYGCSRSMLLYPHHSALSSREGRLASYQMRGTDEGRLSVATISLSSLREIRERLREIIFVELGPRTGSVAA